MKVFKLIFLIVVIACQSSYAQDNARVKVDTSFSDPKYREDQFYVSITYNLLGNKASEISQSGFSSGFHAGYIRDMPINTRRNIAIGVGIGLSANSYNQNMKISEDLDNNVSYSIISEDVTPYTKNKFSTYILEFPLEFRWRTSTEKIYDFWRVYGGLKFGYIFYNSAKYRGEPNDEFVSNIKDFNNLQYGLSLGAGYDTINVYLYYGLNTLFDSNATLDGGSIDMSAIKIGLIFYIL
ncbi:Outer membrane protein beta-barrel domain-containing protein [Flavobacteriaceae bacterium MAR_2010_188]|nr:Outer membrane protein beta-barrel domain-containing protein [Flavobacteriaceae bacterium MAR_2010_188]